MSHITVSKIGSKQAIAIERLIKDRFRLPPCKFCGDDLADFMLPRNFMHAAYVVFCTACGKWSGSKLDSRVVCDFVEAIASDMHPAHGGIIALLTRELRRKDRDFCASDDSYAKFAEYRLSKETCHYYMWLGTYSGLPESVDITYPYVQGPKTAAKLYDWEIVPILSWALNQAVLARLKTIPEFDYDSQFLCKNCGAPPSQQQMQNFNEVLREGDIHCGACGVFIRTWDPN